MGAHGQQRAKFRGAEAKGCVLAIVGVLAPLVAPCWAEEDPWPERLRTPSRLGRTDTVGPQTATIAWRVQADPRTWEGVLYNASPVMDRQNRVYVAHTSGIAVVDPATHTVMRQIQIYDGVDASPSLWNGYLLYGTPQDIFACVNTNNWQEVWSLPAAPHPNRGNVVDASGVVYYPSQRRYLYARRVVDGSEVWTHNHYDGFNSCPSVDNLGQLYIGNFDYLQWLAFRTANGSIAWTFPMGSYTSGTSPVENGRVYHSSPSRRKLYCIDAATGQQIWEFPLLTTAEGGEAIRHDGVIYVNASGGSGWLFAVTPDGKELWRYALPEQALNQGPMIDGLGTAYFCTYKGSTGGWVHAVRADGSALWVKQMPDKVAATPMLAPDGTLYVMCKDKYLYAFHDHMKGDLNCDFWVNFGDINPFVQVLTDPAGWQAAHPDCPLSNGDINGDGKVNFGDINPFVRLLVTSP